MNIGIVGHAQEKFTPETEARARWLIKNLLEDTKGTYGKATVVSGRSPMGGVDIYAEEIADELGYPKLIFPPKSKSWSGGYKARNLQIANASDFVACIVVKDYPPEYRGMVFEQCYHCKDRIPNHVKSGGCWTAWNCTHKLWYIIHPDLVVTRHEPGVMAFQGELF